MNCESHDIAQRDCFQCRILGAQTELRRPLTRFELAALGSDVERASVAPAEMATIEETEEHLAKLGDAIMIVYGEGKEAMPAAVGEGFCATTTKDGGLQLALYWTDRHDNDTRRSVLIQGSMLRFFDSLGDMLGKAVKAARNRKVVQFRGELTNGRDGSS